jgi:hypothetical protein
MPGCHPSQRPELLRELLLRYDPAVNEFARCGDGSPANPAVVAGETWVVVVSDSDGARVVISRLSGEIEPGVGAGPPVSYALLPCTGQAWPHGEQPMDTGAGAAGPLTL